MADVWNEETLIVNEMFTSISGEVGIIPQGQLTSVVRLQSCNLRCSYCDAANSQDNKNGIVVAVKDIVDFILRGNLPVLITGGEPLLQSAELGKLMVLLDKTIVQVETNGTVDLPDWYESINSIVMDYKLRKPPAGANLHKLRPEDYLKFVITSMPDLAETFYIISALEDIVKCKIAISATNMRLYHGVIDVIKKTKRDVLVNVQIHKCINAK